jgi:hypothetical protein
MKKYAIIRAFLTVKWLVVLVVVLYLLFAFIAPDRSTAKLALYKLMLGITAAVIGHIVVKALYPYMSLSVLLAEDKKYEVTDAQKFIGACILRAGVMAAMILGVLLGV